MKKIVLVALAGICSFSLSAKENVGTDVSNSNTARVAAGCSPSQAKTDLNINNVRTTIMGGGDMWWNLSDGQYEIPKGGNKHSLFAGSLWIAGIDAGEQLKAAAMTYRQTGNDFWTGPLDETGEIDAQTCDDYDKHFQVTRAEVDEFLAWYNDKDAYPNYSIPTSIAGWPGNGVNDDYQFLAPYYDANDDGQYKPEDGDYPKYDVDGTLDCLSEDVIYGDQTLWWVFNDKGNIHSETGADPIGLEVRAQAFAFATNDEINNMTFYNYKVINRATIQLKDAYFGQWVDPDLGYYMDDFVGCDVERGLGYCYNGDAEDEGAAGYGFNPPAIGVDFFQGPIADAGDGVDNDRDSIVDEPGEQAIMSRFVYYNNDFTVIGNPENGQHIYNYLRGIWKDGLDITYGNDGRGGSVPAKFMFPGDTDPYGWGTDGEITQADWEDPLGWTEEIAGNNPADRRFVQSAGPFTLEPGAVNRITTGVVWARADAGGPFASVELVRLADDKAQALFDNCFKVLNGPDAPDVGVVELDRELVLHLSNGTTSNNFLEQYIEMDPLIISPPGEDWDPYYRFQGYQVYQLAESWVSATDLDNPDMARLIFQTDIDDEVANLVNYEFDASIGGNVPTLEVSASNTGIEHSISITEDQFATGDRELVNHKPYYFMAVSYAYNEYKPYNQNDPDYLDGQKKPYKAGRKNIRVYTGIPHKGFTTVLNAEIGDGVELTKVLGKGNGGFALSLTEEAEDEILSSSTHQSLEPTYEASQGPVDVRVIDPYHLTQSDFALKLYGEAYPGPPTNNKQGALEGPGARWELLNITTGESYLSDAAIDMGNQQLLPHLGLSIEVEQSNPPYEDYTGELEDPEAGFISANITFENEYQPWLGGIQDTDEEPTSPAGTYAWGTNWIHAGEFGAWDLDNDGSLDPLHALNDYPGDEAGVYEGVLGGTWAPYRFVSFYRDGPGYDSDGNYGNGVTTQNNQNKLFNLESVKIVITSNQENWSRCVVLESQDNSAFSSGEVEKMDLRAGESVDKDGNPDGSGNGMGWFPGYVIDKETGERLNVMFSEDSWLKADNGDDMIWNPTSRLRSSIPIWAGGEYYLGGKHYIYIHNSKYDGCASAAEEIASGTSGKREFFKNMMWVGAPILNEGYELLSSDVEIDINVSKAYRKFVDVDETEFTDNVTISSEANRLSNYFSNYDQLYAYEVTDFSCSDSVRIDGVWHQSADEGDLHYVSEIAAGSEASPATISVSYKKINYPNYRFSTTGIAPSEVISETEEDSVMNLINVVPNPYYAFSSYEGTLTGGQLDNRVRITNLPAECTISIYTLNGSLVRRLNKDSEGSASIDWDLKNHKGIPIASGAYIINVYVPSLGKEKNLKWFGVMRPIDLDTF